MDKIPMNEIKCPQIKNCDEITPELFKQYVQYVEYIRHNQRRWFKLRNYDALKIATDNEKIIDALNARLLDDSPKLF